MKHPLITIIIPVYNTEKYIARCLDSVVKQTYKELEILVIDDGSTDSSYQICNEYALKDDRLKLIHQDNQGLSISRNNGMELATGEYIAFVDSDDWIALNMMEVMIESAMKYNQLLVDCDFISSEAKAKQVSSPKIADETNVCVENSIDSLERIIISNSYAVWTRLYHKSLMENVSFKKNKILEDVPFTLEILSKVTKVIHVELPLYIYYTENTSIIRSCYNLKKLNSIDMVLKLNDYRHLYNKTTIAYVNANIINFLCYNYNALFENESLDKDYSHRKGIKELIKKNIRDTKTPIRLHILLKAPFKIYGFLLKLGLQRYISH